MQITQQNLDALNAEITVQIVPADYEPQVEKSLKDYRKKMQMPGFRPGHVPASVVKQRYGKAILAEEINKALQDAIYKHIADNKLPVLGNPLPKADGEIGDWENPSDFTFIYEIGLAPSIEVELNDKMKFEYFVVDVDDKLIDKQVRDYGRRFGKMSNPETSGAEDLLDVRVQSVDKDGNVVEGGIDNNSTITIEDVKDKKVQKQLVGLKKDDSVVVDPMLLSGDHEAIARALGITRHDLHHFEGQVKLTVNNIHHVEMAEFNQELFDKLFPAGTVTSVDEMRAKVRENMQEVFGKDSNWMFKRSAASQLVETLNPALPDAFMKKWIAMSNEKPLTEEQIEAEYPAYSHGLRWQLIETSIIEKNEIKVTVDEAVDHVKKQYAERFAQYGLPVEDAQLESMAKELLAKREEAKNVYDVLFEDKVIEVVKSKCKVNEVKISFDEFLHKAQHMH
ncbi:MAG: trigger factor [Bacteroidetes bacterium]|nr:trigger factor [Bacteroidota bacterium]